MVFIKDLSTNGTFIKHNRIGKGKRHLVSNGISFRTKTYRKTADFFVNWAMFWWCCICTHRNASDLDSQDQEGGPRHLCDYLSQ